MINIVVNIYKERTDLFVGAKADGAQEDADRQLAFAINFHAHNIALAGFKFQPGAATGDQLGAGQFAARAAIFIYCKIDTGRPNQLTHHHAFATINNKGGGIGHQREVAHKDFLLADFTGIAVHKFNFYPKRRREGDVALAAFIFWVFGFAKVEIAKVQFQIFIKADNGRNLIKQLTQTFAFKPLKATELHLSETRQF